DAAENYFHKAISLDINHFDVYYELGEIYQKKGRIQEAVDFYQKAIAVNPENRAVKEKVRRALLENGLDLDFAL
ncbi:MAG: tetratricopeptide repeat protein, partial [Candidatus Omnitrophica bacterium]|nr:tetratricopeptide repeat protein [Candidatus Omnitrophota bacterium]